ncbi:hypothetical protein [Burkholderia lata]|uniref:hypothetical protein n=1 Tax=Burkholderia lata (strain ATCC 17760 / DSM 23089 / LMG 22485 / NCIMB 9086 / R18194 / 383) TaxID=482957 RepID=UPI0015843F1C|nr:hypothetical protein [Burkholderia lata]
MLGRLPTRGRHETEPDSHARYRRPAVTPFAAPDGDQAHEPVVSLGNPRDRRIMADAPRALPRGSMPDAGYAADSVIDTPVAV